jgi:hypothetical protein
MISKIFEKIIDYSVKEIFYALLILFTSIISTLIIFLNKKIQISIGTIISIPVIYTFFIVISYVIYVKLHKKSPFKIGEEVQLKTNNVKMICIGYKPLTSKVVCQNDNQEVEYHQDAIELYKFDSSQYRFY